jgi:hypothetical protein
MTDHRLRPSLADATALRRPRLIIFDVNETLSDMSPIAARFGEVGLPEHLAATWFAALLRDGFALTVDGAKPSFADLASDGLRTLLETGGSMSTGPSPTSWAVSRSWVCTPTSSTAFAPSMRQACVWSP